MNSLKKKKMNPPGGSIALLRRREQPRLDYKAWVLRLWVSFFLSFSTRLLFYEDLYRSKIHFI